MARSLVFLGDRFTGLALTAERSVEHGIEPCPARYPIAP